MIKTRVLIYPQRKKSANIFHYFFLDVCQRENYNIIIFRFRMLRRPVAPHTTPNWCAFFYFFLNCLVNFFTMAL
jgi:hypothetical protein